MKYLFFYISVLSISLIFLGCQHDHPHEDHNHDGHHEALADEGGDHHVEGETHLTIEQIKTIGIEIGDLSSIKINDFIRATGTLGLPPQSYNTVSAKASGFIKNSNKYVEGSYVAKGTTIAHLQNPDFIKQQQSYLEISAELAYLNQELERHQQLISADAGILKNMQKLQSEVNVKNASLKGIAKQLEFIGINTSNLTPDNISDQIKIRAPMTGYVTSINMHNGMYVSPQLQLLEIISDKHLHLELDVFENDISHLKEEQKISYTIPALGNTVYDGDVHVIGKVFNSENKTVRIHGHLGTIKPRFIKDLFVDAKIWLNDQVVQAVPEKAIVKEGASSYIYITDNLPDNNELRFNKIMVIPGNSDKGYTPIKLIDPIPEGMKLVTKGAYYIYAQSVSGELEHSH